MITQGEPAYVVSIQVFKLRWAILSQTPVSMTHRDILLDPSYFPEPSRFLPERWLSNNPGLARMERVFVPYGRGPRVCIGMRYVILGSTVS